MPSYAKPVQAKIYIKALEDRIADLETLLKNEGDRTASRDHWAASDGAEEDQRWQDNEDPQIIVNAVRDLSHDAAGSYIGGASAITIGRALGKALARSQQGALTAGNNENHILGRTGFIDSYSGYPVGNGFSLLAQMGQETADLLLDAYLKHTSTNFPVIFSVELRELHQRRQNLENAYEESVLQLAYGLGVHFLQKVLLHPAKPFTMIVLPEKAVLISTRPARRSSSTTLSSSTLRL